MKKLLTLALAVPALAIAQQYGPNSPATGTNVGGVGTLSWNFPGNITTSDDNVSSRFNRGTTNYLLGSNFGFDIPNTEQIRGIKMDVEKHASAPMNVNLLDNWVVGTTRTITNGNNRCLIVMIGVENATGPRDVTSVTYGNRPMMPITEVAHTNTAYARLEAWYMLESDLALAENTTINYTFSESSTAANANVEIVSSAVYSNVNQFSPVYDIRTHGTSATETTIFYDTPMNVPAGGEPVASMFTGAKPTDGGASCTIGDAFSEGIDFYTENPSFPGEGATMISGNKYASNNASTTRPYYRFYGPANQRVLIALSLERAWSTDNSVRLGGIGGFKGEDKAKLTEAWPIDVDGVVSYGGVTDLWGTGWTSANINSPAFGGAISAVIQNGGVTIDNIQITVFTTTVLPLEMISFTGAQKGEEISLNWVTASEKNTHKFIIERSIDGERFETAGVMNAAGNSTSALSYEFTDDQPVEGIAYYRVTTIDTDGSTSESDIIAVRYDRAQKAVVYPNPANDWATVLAPEGFDQIIITDANGIIIDQFEGTSLQTEQKLNIEHMPDGVYFVCIKGQNGMTQIQKLMVTSRSM
jgi:hypothetical protein